eukprot:1293101-Prymnesium_polylepis.1
MQPPPPCREASQRVCAGCAPGAGAWGRGSATHLPKLPEAPAWPPARAAGWKASPKRKGDATPGKRLFFRPRPTSAAGWGLG